MNRTLAYAVLLVLGTVGSVAADNPPSRPSNTPSTARPVATEDSLNIDHVKTLDAGGSYIRLEGQSLFLTSNIDLKAPKAGFWFDVGSDPASPVLLNKSLPGAWDVAVIADHALVCDYTQFLKVFDLRGRQWRQISKLEMPSMTENITIRGKLAYVANHAAGLTIVDIADPAKPCIVGKLNPHIDCDGLALWKNYAILYGHWESRLVLVDITDPAKPHPTGIYQHDKGSFNQGEVTVDGDLAYCTSNNGLVIVNIADPACPKLVKSVDIRGGIRDVTVMDGYAFLAAGNQGIHVLDVSSPANPIEVGRCPGKRAQAFELAVLRAPRAQDAGKTAVDRTPASRPPRAVAPACYYVYTAASRAEVLRFQSPARKGAEK